MNTKIHTLLIVAFMLALLPAYAQYTGGNGRGDDMNESYQRQLNGSDASYFGGNGRGDAMATATGLQIGPGCINPTTGGAIAEDQTICEGSAPDSFTSTALPGGHIGDLEYKWQSSTESNATGFADIANSNAAGYQAGTFTQTTWFKRLARVDCMADWSGAAESNVVEITVEQTPVSGTLNKTPDLANVCEGSDVSATLTPGSGGNGIDSLAYRTHDGFNWSAWLDYNSGDNISTLGKTQVEILTLRKADYCNDASAEMVSWSVEQTPVSGILDKTPDQLSACDGDDVSATLSPGSGGNGIDSLAYRTHNGSNWSAWLDYNSGDNISTLGKTQVEILTLRKADYCNDASAEMVSWSVEQTPVSGTLNKTPDLANVCEGSDVSATLTPGSGGNGIDSLAYRTHDGSIWSSWLDYNTGDAISTLGKTQMEIMTLRKTDYCNDASAEIVSWFIEETPVSGTLNKTPDLANVCEGSDVSATLTPGSGGNGIDSLAYRTHDGSNWSAWLDYNSGDNISTLGKTQVEILTLRKADYCNDASAETVSWSVEETPVSGTLNKAPDLANVCEGSDVSATLTPGSGGNGIDSLAYRTHDGSNWSAWIGYNSGDAISTLGKTQVEILTLRKADYCNDASAEIVSWSVEEIPVSGTLNKIPDLANVCEGSDVSATLTPGSGGNGIDSLAYRTHDGSNWSSWLEYNTGDAISTLGKTQVEILTLRKVDYSTTASANIVSWSVEETPVSGTINKTPDLANVCEGSDVSATLTPGSGGNGIDSLAYRTHDGANWSAWLDYNSGDNISTLGKTQVEIMTLRKANYCNDASAEIVSWSVEQTPVSGTLNKTPDLANVCEGSDVSATLTPGSGGNGIDSLAYRTHDGANWSAWLDYNTGDAISTLGKTRVEILTLRKADYCNNASAEIVSWSVEQTPVSGILNKTPDQLSACDGDDVSAILTPGSGGNGVDSLAYRTHDGSNWSAWIGYSSGNAISTLGKTQIEILTLRKADYCNNASAEIVSWSIHPRPVAVAGIDASIAQSETYTLSDATAENYTSVAWSTSGDGTFSSETSLNPVYTPGNNDIAAGVAQLCLTAFAQSPCAVDSSDCMMLTIYRNPLVEITTPADSSTVYDYALTVLGTATDADGDLTEVYVRLNGGGWQLATGTENWSIDLLLTGGYQKIEAKAIDAQSLESDLDEINIFVGIQEIDIYQGWSAISSYLIPLDPALEQVMQNATIPGNLTFMLGQSGMLWPEHGINTIGNWDVYQGYKVKYKQADVLTIFGDKLDENSMTYPAGLYMIPVLSNTPALISAVFSDPENDVEYIFDVAFGGIYWPQGGIVNLSELLPGVGYIAKFNKAVTLAFPDMKMLKSSAIPVVAKNETPGPWAFSRTAEVHLVSIFDDALNDFGNVSHIGAFDSQGNCIGAANITEKGSNILLIAYGDDGSTEIKDGAEEGELITFRAYDAATGIETGLKPVFSESFANHDGLFVSGGLSAITSFKSGATGIGENGHSFDVRVYPNPAKDMLNLVFDDSNSLDGISFELINSNGSKVLSQNISERHTKLNISHLQPGVYILKIYDKGNSVVSKLIIQ